MKQTKKCAQLRPSVNAALFYSYLFNYKQFVKLENMQSGLVDTFQMTCLKGIYWDCYCLSYTLMIYLNPLHFILYYMLMILIFVYLIKILTICRIW